MNSLTIINRKVLVLCAELPDLRSIQNPKACHFILFRAELSLNSMFKEFSYETLDTFIEIKDYDQVRKQLDKEWQDFLKNNLSLPNLHHYHYHFSNNRTSVLFWQIFLEKIITKYRPELIYLPDNMSQPGILELCDEPSTKSFFKFLNWALRQSILLYSIQSGLNIVYYREVSNLLNKQYQKRKYLDILFNRFLALWEKKSHYLSKLTCLNNGGIKPLLLVTQKPKAAQLLNAFVKNKIKYKLSTYEKLKLELYKYSGLSRSRFTFRFQYDQKTSTIDPLEKWLVSICRFHDSILDSNIHQLLDKYQSPFITDGQHDPMIRRVSDYISKTDNWLICTIPEGGLSFFSMEKNEIFLFRDHNNLVHCLGSEHDQEVYNRIDHASTSIVCGYNTAYQNSAFYGHILRKFLKWFCGARGKTIVFYDHHPFYNRDMGIVRTNAVDESRMYAGIRSLLRNLNTSDFYILTSTRGHYPKFSLLSGGKVYVSGLHFSILVQCADILISGQSSIILETLNLSKPVMCWHPFDEVPNHFSFLNHVESNVYRPVSKEEDILKTTNFLLTATQNEFYKYKKYLADPNYIGLIKIIQKSSS